MESKRRNTTLGEICRLVAGSAFPQKYQGRREGIPFVKVSDMNLPKNEWEITVASNYVDRDTLSIMKAKTQPRGATVFAKIGEALRFNRMRMLTNDTAIDNNMMAAIPNSDINEWFLYYLISSLQLSRYAEGSALPYLKQSTLNKTPVVIPNDEAAQRQTSRVLYALDRKMQLNNQINGYLAAICESLAEKQQNTLVPLGGLCQQVNEKTDFSEANFDSYISTESLLPEKMGRQTASSLPKSGKVTKYQAGDTLVSNIRPYFKKVWFADCNGTCSGDVIVFRARNASMSPYLYSLIRSDSFFEYVMLGSKGTKMPRGDKKQMMTYPVAASCNQADLQLITFCVHQLTKNARESVMLSELRDTLLPKLMSGEIDVSKVEVPTQSNSHLSGC